MSHDFPAVRHLTLSFLGDLEASAEDQLRQALGEVQPNRVEMHREF